MKKKQKRIYIYGKNAVREAVLKAPHIIKALYLSPQMNDGALLSLVHASRIKTERMDPKKVSSQVEGNAAHQGIIAQIAPQGLMMPFEEFIKTMRNEEHQMFVYLDGVQDPHNVGAIIRSSAAFGASAVLMPERGTSPVTQGVINASAGALFSIPIVSVANPQQALAEMRRLKVKIYGMAGEGAADIHEETFEGPTLLVMGNEAEGISPATRALCEKMLRIPISRDVESLNVASAAAAALFAWSGRHREAL
jgi:23S rRNA (guanosine2251-2'-O)-methyltransferase